MKSVWPCETGNHADCVGLVDNAIENVFEECPCPCHKPSIEDRLIKLEVSNVRRVLREGVVNAQLREIAQAILELSQFEDEPGLTLGSRANMQSILRAPNFDVTGAK